MTKPCRDCEPGSKRPATFPGPRCATHDRMARAARRKATAGRRVENVYGVTPAQYDALYEAQGGRCAICQRATGRSKRLAVDHDHVCAAGHPVDRACPECVRGLLCSWCNRKVVGWLRDNPAAFDRGAAYLRNPPARQVIGKQVTSPL